VTFVVHCLRFVCLEHDLLGVGCIAFPGRVAVFRSLFQHQATSSNTNALSRRYGAKNGAGMLGWGANFRNSFIGNTVEEGNHVWNYNTLPTPSQDPSEYPYFPGGSKTIEPWFFGSLTNDQV
jgi:hypothetical protein